LNLTAAFQGVAVDSAGNLYIADPRNNRIRMVNTAGIITTYAGNGNIFQTAHGDGAPPFMAGLSTPYGVRVDSAGNIFIADTGDNIIREVTGGAGCRRRIGSHHLRQRGPKRRQLPACDRGEFLGDNCGHESRVSVGQLE